MTNRLPRSRASEAFLHSVRLFRHVFCRPCVCRHHPCDGQSNNQALCGHHSLLAGNHRTLQAFYHQPPSWGVETWVDDDLQNRQGHGEEVTWIDRDGMPCHPYGGRPGTGHREGRRADHRDDNCQAHYAG